MAERVTEWREGMFVVLPVNVGTTIEEGCMVVIDSTGYAKTAAEETGLVTIGIAESTVAAETEVKHICVRRKGLFLLDNSTGADMIKQEHVFKPCYAVGASEVAAKDRESGDAATRSSAGIVVEIVGDKVWVEIGGSN